MWQFKEDSWNAHLKNKKTYRKQNLYNLTHNPRPQFLKTNGNLSTQH